MRVYLPHAFNAPELALRGLEALEPLWTGVAVTGLKPRGPSRPTGDKERAREIYAGMFTLEGQTLYCRGRSIFALQPPSAAFAAALHGFGWLADLNASGRALDRAHARALVADWLSRTRQHPSARLAQVRAHRLTAWVKAAPFLLEAAGEDFTQRFFKGLTSEIRWMLPPRWQSADRFAAALALAHAVAGLSGLEPLEKLARQRLNRALASAFPEGMPPSRNASELAASLEDITHLRADFASALAPLENALAHLTLSDGKLARFQGADAEASPVHPAPAGAGLLSGFARLGQGETSLVLDAGPQISAASLLGFELACGGERIITQCGRPAAAASRWHEAATRLAAHSAPCLGTQDPAPVLGQVEYGTTSQGVWCIASHEGFVGFETRRSLFLTPDGKNLRGQDNLTRTRGEAQEGPLTLRFHLAPDTDARLAEDGASVLLAAGLQIWNFTAKGAALAVEDSISLAGLAAPVPAKQITLTVANPIKGAEVKWAFRRVA